MGRAEHCMSQTGGLVSEEQTAAIKPVNSDLFLFICRAAIRQQEKSKGDVVTPMVLYVG
jgi:hypothetical protein